MSNGAIKNGNDLKREHFMGFDPEYWVKRSDRLVHDLNNSQGENKSDIIFELYSIYLQAIEVFFINQFTLKLRNDNFIKAIFIANDQLRQKIIADQNKGFPDVRGFFNDIYRPLLATHLDNSEKAAEQVRKFMPIFSEIVKDYLQDYDLLNAYKHGFRVQFKDEKASLYLGVNGVNSMVSETDFRIEYITKKIDKDRGEQIIYMPMITFNKHRLVEKTRFITRMIANQVSLKQHGYAEPKPEKIQFYFFEFEDEAKWKKSFGNMRFKKPILSGPIGGR